MNLDSPYLKPGRLGDVIAAVQFLGQYEDYKRSVADWTEKFATPPRSENSWAAVFEEHPEFFRTNDEGLVSLVWRRALAKTSERFRPPLEPDSVAKLIDVAVRLYSTAVDTNTADEEKKFQEEQGNQQRRQWEKQMRVSVLTAILAFIGVMLAGWLKASS